MPGLACSSQMGILVLRAMAIEYRNDQRPSTAEIKRLYENAGLLDAPVNDEDRMRRMFEGSNVVWTAWERVGSEVRLVGVLRGWTDGAYDGYVSDLAVDGSRQKQGIGRELLARVIAHYGQEVQWVLRSSPVAANYYQRLGWQKVSNGWNWLRTVKR
jgi:ribosomal protein S18 acetylase RimI-like enzyme